MVDGREYVLLLLVKVGRNCWQFWTKIDVEFMYVSPATNILVKNGQLCHELHLSQLSISQTSLDPCRQFQA